MSNLPGEGKPLKLDIDPNVPEHLRVTFKLLKDNGYAPEWILLGQEIEARHEQLLNNIQKGIRAYKGALQDAERDANNGAQLYQLAQKTWELAKKSFHEAAQKLNREILNYNLKVPQGIMHKAQLDVEYIIKQLML